MSRVTNLFRAPKRRDPMEELEQVEAVVDCGFADCSHARPEGKRQVLLVDRETLNTLRLSPGIIRENITTEGLEVNALQPGQRLKIGNVQLEVSIVCEPCALMEKIRPGLQKELESRRGMFCRVLQGGTIHRGAAIEKIS